MVYGVSSGSFPETPLPTLSPGPRRTPAIFCKRGVQRFRADPATPCNTLENDPANQTPAVPCNTLQTTLKYPAKRPRALWVEEVRSGSSARFLIPEPAGREWSSKLPLPTPLLRLRGGAYHFFSLE